MAPLPDQSSWDNYIQHVKFWRNEVKRSLGESISNIELVKHPDGRMAIIGLATAPGDSSSNQMVVMHAEIPADAPIPSIEDDIDDKPLLELKPLIDPKLAAGLMAENLDGNSKPPPELALHYERMRGHMTGGVIGYCLHASSGAVLISTPTQLTIYKDNQLTFIAQWLEASTVLNASFCEANPEFVAFNSQGQLFVDKCNQPAFVSDTSRPNITNGVASFVAQEEFERYDGYYWSPTRVELVYERVDESPVVQLPFTLPGVRPEADEEPMRYPLAGTQNAISTVRICRLDEHNCEKLVDLELDADLRTVVPWMEYIVWLGWTADGNDVYVLVMNRVQTQMAVLCIPRTCFVQPTELGKGIGQIKQVYQENSKHWINANNLLRFLPPFGNQRAGGYDFLIGSERTDLCHLYLQNTLIPNSNAITSGLDWAVLKEAVLKVDTEKGLVFYLANRISPLLLSLCVSSYVSPSANGCRVLTPSNLCYKFERSCPTLYLNTEIGFVCWLSSITQLPQCHFYRFVYTADDPLPRAVFSNRICVQVLPSSHGLNTSTWGLPYLYRAPSEIFSHRFFEFVSQNSGKTHYALLLWPARSENDNKFPVIQAVYAGPSIQLVRDSWQTISQYLKFVSYGYAVVLLDGRGSTNRGVQFEATIKERLGSIEIEDQMEGLRVVAEQSELLDLERVAVIGWSYGGFASLLLLAEYPNLYRCACVGGAVSDWNLYDTAYTEKSFSLYMGLPQDNEDAYNKSALASRIHQLPNQEGRLLIVHGMIDENVHFSQCSKLISTLISAQKPHQLLLFPGERHAIRNSEAIEFFHANILSFFGKALSLERKPRY